MQVRFLIDPDTELPHIFGHGVDEAEALSVLRRAELHLQGKNNARIALGQTDAGRYLKVIYKRNSDGIFIITAYDLRGKELKAFRRRRRR